MSRPAVLEWGVKEFFIWTQIQHVDGLYHVVVTAVPINSGGGGVLTSEIMRDTAPTQQAATESRSRMILIMGKRVRDRGGCVVDTEIA